MHRPLLPVVLLLAACGGALHLEREPEPGPSAIAEVPVASPAAPASGFDAEREAAEVAGDRLDALVDEEHAPALRTLGGAAEGSDEPGRAPIGLVGVVRGSGVGGGGYGEGAGLGAKLKGAEPRLVHPPRPLQPLRAGTTDDNADFASFLTFLGTWTDRPGFAARWQPMNVRDRGLVRVSDASGRPLPGATVTLLADGRPVHTARTYGDGGAPVYPWIAPGAGTVFEVEVSAAGGTARTPWSPGTDADVALRVASAPEDAVPVDVAIVLDTTGSMSDEIERIKETLLTTVGRLEGLDRPVALRFGAVLYRDHGDDYVTRAIPFTEAAQGFDQALRRVEAGGGGDTPEALNEGLAAAVGSGLRWRAGAAKVAFLIADAPPHMDYAQDVPYGTTALKAVGEGVRVHTVAASGLDEAGSLVFRQIAQLTRGRFVFIEYGGDVARSAASHGVASAEQVASNNLDQILFDRIKAEVDGWRR